MAAKRNLILDRTHPSGSGTQQVYRFDNGYGASVIQFRHSYGYEQGLFELGVLVFGSDRDSDWHLTYDTPITSDVIGHLTPEQVSETLDQIAALPARETA